MLDSPHTLAPMLMRGNALVLKNTPPSHAGKQIQLYLKSLELKNLQKGLILVSLTAVKAQFPHATT